MKVDSTLARILLIIQEEVKEKYNTTLTVEQIHKVVCVQIEATKRGIRKGLTIHWSRFGKFVFTNKSKLKLETIKLTNLLEHTEGLLPHEKLEIRKEKIIELSTIKKEYIKKSTLNLSKSISGEEVLGVKRQSSIPIFTVLTKPKKDE